MWHLRVFTTKHTSDSLSQREPRTLSNTLVLYMMSLEPAINPHCLTIGHVGENS